MKQLRNYLAICFCLVLSIMVFAPSNAKASGANGAEDFMAGALPPPGFYYANYLNYYTADKLKDSNGNKFTNPKISVVFDANRFLYVTDYKILGGNFAVHTLIPLANIKAEIFGRKTSNSGIGDIIITPAMLAWHSKNWHAVAALDVMLPTGQYKDTEPSIGANCFATEPAFAFTYMSDNGIEFSSKLMYDINFENDKTKVTKGNEFHVDSLLGFHLDKWKIGANTYFYKQLTKDSGGTVPNTDKTQVFAVGPAIGYEYNHIHFAFKYQKEMQAKNKAEGDSLWFKVAVPF